MRLLSCFEIPEARSEAIVSVQRGSQTLKKTTVQRVWSTASIVVRVGTLEGSFLASRLRESL
mgnify:CR=1 FL=1